MKKWKVKIEKLASWIGVGVSHLDSVKSANFDFSYTNAGHGNYLVSSNGYSWNGYKMEFNSKHETFQYKTGDIIEIAYDPVQSKITFSKADHEKSFTYEIDPNQKPIHASINMTGMGDCV